MTSFILLLLLFVHHTNGVQNVPKTFIDISREKYFQLEHSLWIRINESNIPLSTQSTVVKEHRKFIDHHLNSTWDEHKYAIMNFYEWNMLLRKLMHMENLFQYFQQLMDLLIHNEGKVIGEEVTSILRNIVNNNPPNTSNFSLIDVFNNIELVMVKQAILYRALLVSSSLCSL